MKKKILSYIGGLTMLLLCACGGGADSAGGTLTICADGNGMNEMFLGPILAEFERQNPDVELVV